MKVKCIQLLDEQNISLDKSGWLTIGRIYHVLSIIVEKDRPVSFQLIGDDEITPAYHNANLFEVISDIIPSSWAVASIPNKYFELAPRAWLRPGFLEDYFNGVEDAISLFELEKEKIIRDDP
jgi:hypothetical protein